MSWQAKLQEDLMREQCGVPTLLGDDPTTYYAIWHIAEQSRSRQHLPEGEWDVPAYIVALPVSVRQSSALHNGVSVTNVVTGVVGVLRFMNNAATAFEEFTVTVLVLILDR